MSKEIRIIFEDNNLLVLDKPTGWVTTKENLKFEIGNLKYVEDWIKTNRPNGLAREGIVHRLDKGTSGVLLVAKNSQTLGQLKLSFKEKRIKKTYLALVGGKISLEGDVVAPIGRIHGTFGRFGVKVDGKAANTGFKLIDNFIIDGQVCSLVEVRPLTGRTHQIRVHLKYLGWPVCGDRQYGGLTLIGLSRIFLHAHRIELEDGRVFSSGLPEDLKSLLDKSEKLA